MPCELAGLCAGIELFLQIPERLVRQALLISQRLGQAFHGLLTGIVAALPLLAFGHPQVLHHLLEFFQRLLRLGKAALFHQLLDAIHHVLQVLIGQHLHVTRLAPVGLVGLISLALRLLRFLAQVILGRVAQFLHQPRDLVLARAVPHRLAQALLRRTHPLQRVADIAVFQQDGQVP